MLLISHNIELTTYFLCHNQLEVVTECGASVVTECGASVVTECGASVAPQLWGPNLSSYSQCDEVTEVMLQLPQRSGQCLLSHWRPVYVYCTLWTHAYVGERLNLFLWLVQA